MWTGCIDVERCSSSRRCDARSHPRATQSRVMPLKPGKATSRPLASSLCTVANTSASSASSAEIHRRSRIGPVISVSFSSRYVWLTLVLRRVSARGPRLLWQHLAKHLLHRRKEQPDFVPGRRPTALVTHEVLSPASAYFEPNWQCAREAVVHALQEAIEKCLLDPGSVLSIEDL